VYHTLSFHLADSPSALLPAILPLMVLQWPGYVVHFPNLTRHISDPYATISSERFDRVVRDAFIHAGSELFLDTVVTRVTSRDVVLEDGRHLSAEVVIDARGAPRLSLPRRACFQKFAGPEVRLTAPGPWLPPVLHVAP